MAYAERIKEVNEKFQQELEHHRGKLDILKEVRTMRYVCVCIEFFYIYRVNLCQHFSPQNKVNRG